MVSLKRFKSYTISRYHGNNSEFVITLVSRYPNCQDTETPFGDSLSEQILSELVWIPRPPTPVWIPRRLGIWILIALISEFRLPPPLYYDKELFTDFDKFNSVQFDYVGLIFYFTKGNEVCNKRRKWNSSIQKLLEKRRVGVKISLPLSEI